MSAAFKPSIVFVLGGPGAGKGTQCEKIVNVSLLLFSSFYKFRNSNFFKYLPKAWFSFCCYYY